MTNPSSSNHSRSDHSGLNHRTSAMHSVLSKDPLSGSEQRQRVSCLWIWNSGAGKQKVLGESTDDELDWENLRESPARSLASGLRSSEEFDLDNDDSYYEDDLNDAVEGERCQIENMPDEMRGNSRRRSNKPQMSTSVSSYDMGATGGRSVETIKSIDTLSYDDDVVATFDDEAKADEISKAVEQALSRARSTYQRRRESLQRREMVSESLGNLDLTSEDEDDFGSLGNQYIERTTGHSINHLTAHTAVSMVSSRYDSSELRSFGDQDNDDISTDESAIFSEKHFPANAQDDEDLKSIVSSDFHSSDLESLDGNCISNVNNIHDFGEKTASFLPERLTPQKKKSEVHDDLCSPTESVDDLSGSSSHNQHEETASSNHGPPASSGSDVLSITNTEMTGSIVSSTYDSNDDAWNDSDVWCWDDDNSQSGCSEFSLDLRTPLQHTLSGITFSQRRSTSSRSLPVEIVQAEKTSSPSTPDSWKKVVSAPPPPKPQVQSAPAPRSRKSLVAAKSTPVQSSKSKFVNTGLVSKRWSKVEAGPRNTLQETSSKPVRSKKPIETGAAKRDTKTTKKSKHKKKEKKENKKEKKKKRKKKKKKQQSSTTGDLESKLLPQLSPTAASSESAGTGSSRTKERNKVNLDQLTFQMNSAIGVQLSPGSLARKKMSLSQRRDATKKLREKLCTSFNDMLAPIPTSVGK